MLNSLRVATLGNKSETLVLHSTKTVHLVSVHKGVLNSLRVRNIVSAFDRNSASRSIHKGVLNSLRVTILGNKSGTLLLC